MGVSPPLIDVRDPVLHSTFYIMQTDFNIIPLFRIYATVTEPHPSLFKNTNGVKSFAMGIFVCLKYYCLIKKYTNTI